MRGEVNLVQSIHGYRVADNGEYIRIADGRESRTDFYFVRGGRTA